LMEGPWDALTGYIGEVTEDEWISDEEHAEVLRLAGEIPYGNMPANYGEPWKNLINENYEKKYGHKFGEEPIEDQSNQLPPVTPSPGLPTTNEAKIPDAPGGDPPEEGGYVEVERQPFYSGALGRSSAPSEPWDPSLEEPEESATPMFDFSSFKFPSLNLDLGFNKMPQYSKTQLQGIKRLSKPFSFFGQGRNKRRRGGR